ncbi:hypothetical protein SDC9_167040 [bioreactor metagenome]|uniref:Uncharacterized protein n=1 Tax=bioreactor metagenome TaxID=1076179 RepID=A0A645FYP4_9ZZZZ|nr:hypothetical protein [Victivallaceae bacterium]
MIVLFYVIAVLLLVALGTPVLKFMVKLVGGGQLEWKHAAIIMTIATVLGLIPYVGWLLALGAMYYLVRDWGDTDSTGGTVLTVVLTNAGVKIVLVLLAYGLRA